MKKFLTVLLALSVVFTYTVGTAFAAVPTVDVQKAVNDKIQDELKLVEAARIEAVRDIKFTTYPGLAVDGTTKFVNFPDAGSNIYFTTDEVDLIVKMVIADATSALEKQGEGVLKTTHDNADKLNDALAAINAGDYKDKDKFKDAVMKYADLDDLCLEYAKDRYTKIINAVDLDKYSAEKDSTGVSNRDRVKKEQTDALNAIATATVPYTTSGSVQDIAQNFHVAISNISTITKDEYDAADLAAVKDLAIAAMQSAYANEKADLIAAQTAIIRTQSAVSPQTDATRDAIEAAKDEIAKINEIYAAATSLLKTQIEALDSINNLNVYGADGVSWPIGTYNKTTLKFAPSQQLVNAGKQYMVLAPAKVDKIEELNEKAKLAKQFIGIEGSKFYTEADVDDALDAAIAEVYAAKNAGEIAAIKLDAMTPAQALAARIAALIGKYSSGNKATVVVNKSAYPTVNEWAVKAGTDYTYDSDVADAVAALAEDTEIAIKEAKSIEDAERIFLEAYEKYDAFVTTAENSRLYVKGGTLYDTFTSYEAQIKAAVEAKKIITNGNTDYSFDTSAPGKFAANLIAEMKKANTKEELDSKFNEAKKVIEEVKTISAIKAEAKALNDRIMAVKDAVASKDEVIAVMDGYTALNDYVDTIDMASVKKPILYTDVAKSYLQKIADAEAKAINSAIKEIGKVTVEDKEAIEKVVADKDALDKMVKKYKLTAPTVNGFTNLESDLSKAEVAEVVKMIMNLDTKVTADNISAVRAAQAAYDALKAGQKASIDDTVYDKLIAVGKLADKFEVTSVETLKITASSSAVKGKITVKWKVKGDAAAADGYQVWKSTKAQKNYKFMGKTKKSSMVNKKGIKKGTRYFYKVRAYKVVDGKYYYSDWSNKANRIAK